MPDDEEALFQGVTRLSSPVAELSVEDLNLGLELVRPVAEEDDLLVLLGVGRGREGGQGMRTCHARPPGGKYCGLHEQGKGVGGDLWCGHGLLPDETVAGRVS